MTNIQVPIHVTTGIVIDYYSSISFQRYKIFQAAADNSLEVSAWQAVANAVANAWPVGEIW